MFVLHTSLKELRENEEQEGVGVQQAVAFLPSLPSSLPLSFPYSVILATHFPETRLESFCEKESVFSKMSVSLLL